MHPRHYFTAIMCCLITVAVSGQAIALQPLGFVKNNGQIRTAEGAPLDQLVYLLKLDNGLQMQLRYDGFSYDAFSVVDESGTVTIDRMDVHWLGGNKHPKIEAFSPARDLLHYPTADNTTLLATTAELNRPNTERVQHFKRVVFRDVYPLVDMEFIANPSEKISNEYNFILQKGAHLSDVLLEYRGATLLSLRDSILVFQLGEATLTERLPHSFRLATGEAIEVQYCEEQTTDGSLVIGFQSSEDLLSEAIMIDPIPHLDWATYYGGEVTEDLRDLAIDEAGNIYAIGQTSSSTNIASSGAHQTSFNARQDAIILKFTAEGERLWSTYFGGDEQDIAEAISIGPNGDVFITMTTGSEFGITSPGTDQPDFGGGFLDGLLVRFNPEGELIWSTYLGGNSNDHAFALDVSDMGEIYVAGRTKSFNGIATANGFQQSISGDIDAFLMKYDINGQRIWGTYFGGTRVDIGSDIQVAGNGEVILSGWTESDANFSTADTHQPLYGGGQSDMFLAKFTAQGIRTWCTYLGGANNDFANALGIDLDGRILVGGSSFSPNNIGTIGTHQPTSDGSGDAVLAKFDINGQRLWGTYYGGQDTDVIADLSIDAAGNIYTVGYAKSLEDVATIASSQSVHNGGIWDAMLIKFTPEGQREWGTYHGGPEAEQGFGLVVNNEGQIFISGITRSTSGMTTPDAYQLNFGGGNDDAFLARFSPCAPPSLEIVNGGFICDDFPSHLQLNISNSACVTIHYSLDGVLQTPLDIFDTTFELPIPTSLQDSINIISINSEECLGTIEGPNFIRRSPPIVASPVFRDCNDNAATYRVFFSMSGGNEDYYELDNYGEFNANIFESYPIPYDSPFSFRVSSTDSCSIIIINGFFNCDDVCPELGLEIIGETAYCLGDDLAISASFGDDFRWSGPAGFAANEQAISITNLTAAQAGEYQLIVDHTFACHDTILFEVDVHQLPSLALEPSSNLSCENSTTDLLISSAGDGALTYSLNNGPFQSEPIFRALGPGTHTVIVQDDIGCEQTTALSLSAPLGLEILDIDHVPTSCNAAEGAILVRATGNGRLQYALNGGNLQNAPSFYNLPAGEYTLTVIDEESCTDSRLLSIESKNCPIYFPTAFSPNLDGRHDVFRAFPPNDLDGVVKTYQIFDRWGGLVYTAANFPLSGQTAWWNGSSIQGEKAEEGVYIYLIHIDLDNGEQRIERGSIMLIR